MTVIDLYKKLKKEIEAGHGNVPVMIMDNDGDYSYQSDVKSLEHFDKCTHWPEFINLSRN